MKQLLISLLFLFTLAACGGAAVPTERGGDVVTIETVDVAPYRIPCAGFVGIRSCLVLTDESGSLQQVTGIEGFEQEVGFAYRLKVTKTVYEEPPADGNAFDFALAEILTKEPADTNLTFTIALPTPQTGLYALASGSFLGFQVGSSLNMEVASIDLYDEAITAFGEGAHRVDFTAQLHAPPRSGILLIGIECIGYVEGDCSY